MSSLTNKVPILSCGGISKLFCCPGWRLGWIAISDPCRYLEKSIRPGLIDLSKRSLGPSSILQAALPRILEDTPKSFTDKMINKLQKNARYVYAKLRTAPGLKPILSQGTIFMLVQIDASEFNEDDIRTADEFYQKLMNEESVFCLPGTIFGIPSCIRLVLSTPFENMVIACERIIEFCQKHALPVKQ